MVDSGPFTPTMPPVLINHGDYGDAASWLQYIIDYGDGSLPYLLKLADYGYDLWFSNNRGTWYSQGHVSLDPTTDGEYWDFSWADMGLYDDTANIRTIQEATGVQKLFYMGWS